MIDLMSHLLRLQAIVEEGSLRRAATRLNLTQPALSRSITQIEERLGQPLLKRHARGVVPTAFGEQVLSSVLRLSRQWELAEEELLTGAPSLSGTLRIEAGPLWRLVVLPKLLGAMQSEFPDLTIEINNLGAGTEVNRLVEGEVDAVFGGLQFATDLPARLVSRAFTQFHDRVVARENHPVFDRVDPNGHVAPKNLLDYPWLVYTTDPIYEIEIVHGAAEILGRAPDIRVNCESLTAALSILQNTDCLSILPDAAVTSAIHPAILPVPVAVGRRSARAGAIFREEMAEWPPMSKLLQLCEEYFVTKASETETT